MCCVCVLCNVLFLPSSFIDDTLILECFGKMTNLVFKG